MTRLVKYGAGGGGGGGANHNLLDGSVHPDTVAQTVSRGSLPYGDTTPKWNELVIGGARSYLGSDGTDVAWKQSFPYVLVADGANAASPADTLENTLKSVTVPGGAIGANGKLRLHLWVLNAGTNGSKTLRVKLGGTTIYTQAFGATDTFVYELWIKLFNRNAQNSQYRVRELFGLVDESDTQSTDTGQPYNSAALFTIDTSVDATLAVTIQLANSLDSLNLRGWFVEILRA